MLYILYLRAISYHFDCCIRFDVVLALYQRCKNLLLLIAIVLPMCRGKDYALSFVEEPLLVFLS